MQHVGRRCPACFTELQWAPVTQTRGKRGASHGHICDDGQEPQRGVLEHLDAGLRGHGQERRATGAAQPQSRRTHRSSPRCTVLRRELKALPRPGLPCTPPVTVAVQPSGVVLNGKTYSDIPGTPTQTVVAGGETFVINPSEVVGAGATINRASVLGGVFAPQPTSTTINGVKVDVSSWLPPLTGLHSPWGQTPITTSNQGQSVTIGPQRGWGRRPDDRRHVGAVANADRHCRR